MPAQDSLLLIGSPLRDIRHELVGGFAGPIAPDNAVGTYGGTTLLRHQAAGGFAGSRDDQRQGSFADTDRVVIITHKRDVERARITGLRGARRLLRRAALDAAAFCARARRSDRHSPTRPARPTARLQR